MGYLTRAAFQRETGRSRREVDGLLAAGMPHETVGVGRGSEIRIDRAKAMAWLATRALDGKNGGRSDPPPRPDMPSWLEAIVERAPTGVETGYCIGIMGAIYQAPLLVAAMAIRCRAGLTMDQAFAVSDAVSAGLLHHLFEDARRAGIEPFGSSGADGPEIICPDAFLPVDWRQLAREAGEPGWVPPRFNHIWPAPDDDEETAEGDAVRA